MLHDPVDAAMVEAIHRIGRVMGKQTIAESVETPAILEAVRSVGVDFAQGNAIAAPAMFAPPGLRSRSSGEHRDRADSANRNAASLRTAAVLVSRIADDRNDR
jgi:EAL domain-containing protein (putative c-di-GMP-specific phosphodiesterase class I)